MTYSRCKSRPALAGWRLIREALQADPYDLPDLLWLAEAGLMVVTWD